MAKKIKDYYDRSCVELIAAKIAAVQTSFDEAAFVSYVVPKLADQEFSARQDTIADGLETFLPPEYPKVLSIFRQILGPALPEPEGMFTSGWWLWPIGRYIERQALKDPAATYSFLYELTQRFTGEFAIRPLLIAQPKETLTVLEKWTHDDSVHVRRLASEGMRISLPWAKKSLAVLDHLPLFTKILTNLKDAPEKFVQKSVGNNLNDLMKIEPAKAQQIIAQWQADSPSPATEWIIRHGTRSLRKTSAPQ